MPQILEIPDEYLRAIGRVANQWNYLDSVFNVILIHFLGMDISKAKAFVVFPHMAFPQKLHILESISALSVDTRLENYKSEVQPLLIQAQKGRNLVIHSIWGMKDGRVTRASLSARGSLKLTWQPATLKEIEAAHKSIEDATAALAALIPPGWRKSIPSPQSGQ